MKSKLKIGDIVPRPNGSHRDATELLERKPAHVVHPLTGEVISVHETPVEACKARDALNVNFKVHWNSFRPDRRKASDGGERTLSNADHALIADAMLALVPDADRPATDTNLTDALAEFLHWCDREEVDFDAALEMAREHHRCER